ncbi:YciI-like protein [Sphingomonas colocasiae]|uniref:YciI family protein n=1 Tax=Sphingomonas colocasiae TaxID=1848973 RepID=A0ABS7PM60_9SPHN|nr:YciI-like protein [Sphingomonas colocasiae]MBY8822398.1 YciI family protein [Sphingomonas colocasiae]
MRHFVLTYELAPDYIERRPLFRAPHLALAWAAAERGELVLAGALGDPVEGAMLLFQGESAAVAEAFALADPYVANGLVTSWRVLPWATVAGEQAAVPVRPE